MIYENVKNLLREIPADVELLAAAKNQPPEKILQAIEAGIRIVGENYVQEAQEACARIGNKVSWHFIGHLQ